MDTPAATLRRVLETERSTLEDLYEALGDKYDALPWSRPPALVAPFADAKTVRADLFFPFISNAVSDRKIDDAAAALDALLVKVAGAGNTEWLEQWAAPVPDPGALLDAAVASRNPETIDAANAITPAGYAPRHLLAARGDPELAEYLLKYVAPGLIAFSLPSIPSRDDAGYLFAAYSGERLGPDSVLGVALRQRAATTGFFEAALFTDKITPELRTALFASTFPDDADWPYLSAAFAGWSSQSKAAYVRPFLDAAVGQGVGEDVVRVLLASNALDPDTLSAVYTFLLENGAVAAAANEFETRPERRELVVGAVLRSEALEAFVDELDPSAYIGLHTLLVADNEYAASLYLVSIADDDTKNALIDEALMDTGSDAAYLRALLLYGLQDGDNVAVARAARLIGGQTDGTFEFVSSDAVIDPDVLAAVLATPDNDSFDLTWPWVAEAGEADFVYALTEAARFVDEQRIREIFDRRAPVSLTTFVVAAARAGNQDVVDLFTLDETSKRRVANAAAAGGHTDLVLAYLVPREAALTLAHAATGGYAETIAAIRNATTAVDTRPAARVAIQNGYYDIWERLVPRNLGLQPIAPEVGAVASPTVVESVDGFLVQRDATPQDIARKTAAIKKLAENQQLSDKVAVSIARVAAENGAQFAVDTLIAALLDALNVSALLDVLATFNDPATRAVYDRSALFVTASARAVPVAAALVRAGYAVLVPAAFAENDEALEDLFVADVEMGTAVATRLIATLPLESMGGVVSRAAQFPSPDSVAVLDALEERFSDELGTAAALPDIVDPRAVEEKIEAILPAGSGLAAYVYDNGGAVPPRYAPWLLCGAVGDTDKFNGILEKFRALLDDKDVVSCLVYGTVDMGSGLPDLTPELYKDLLLEAIAAERYDIISYLVAPGGPVDLAPIGLEVAAAAISSGAPRVMNIVIPEVLVAAPDRNTLTDQLLDMANENPGKTASTVRNVVYRTLRRFSRRLP